MNENPETSNRVPVADLAVDACSARGATATPMTDREDKVIRHYCDISWQERYDLMREHAETMEKLARIGELAIAAQKSTDYYCNESTIQPSEEDWRIDGTEEHKLWNAMESDIAALRAAIDALSKPT